MDEAHCASEWSHNFRPSYLQIQQICTKLENLRREKKGQEGGGGEGIKGWRDEGLVRVLALTATATQAVCDDVARQLGVSEEDAIIRSPNRFFFFFF